MNGRNYVPGDNTMKPGPGTYHPERVSYYFDKIGIGSKKHG